MMIPRQCQCFSDSSGKKKLEFILMHSVYKLDRFKKFKKNLVSKKDKK